MESRHSECEHPSRHLLPEPAQGTYLPGPRPGWKGGHGAIRSGFLSSKLSLVGKRDGA